MPCIKVIDSIKICVYSRDHLPPHFHAKYAEFEELIIIDTLETYSGIIPGKKRKKVIEWAENSKEYLKTEWNRNNVNNKM